MKKSFLLLLVLGAGCIFTGALLKLEGMSFAKWLLIPGLVLILAAVGIFVKNSFGNNRL